MLELYIRKSVISIEISFFQNLVRYELHLTHFQFVFATQGLKSLDKILFIKVAIAIKV